MDEEKKFIEEHPEADFIGVVQVGMHGVKRFFTDNSKYNEFLDRAWDSGHDLYCAILKGKRK